MNNTLNTENLETYTKHIDKILKQLYNDLIKFQDSIKHMMTPYRESSYNDYHTKTYTGKDCTIILDPEYPRLFYNINLYYIANKVIDVYDEVDIYKNMEVFCIINDEIINKSKEWKIQCIRIAKEMEENYGGE